MALTIDEYLRILNKSGVTQKAAANNAPAQSSQPMFGMGGNSQPAVRQLPTVPQLNSHIPMEERARIAQNSGAVIGPSVNRLALSGMKPLDVNAKGTGTGLVGTLQGLTPAEFTAETMATRRNPLNNMGGAMRGAMQSAYGLPADLGWNQYLNEKFVKNQAAGGNSTARAALDIVNRGVNTTPAVLRPDLKAQQNEEAQRKAWGIFDERNRWQQAEPKQKDYKNNREYILARDAWQKQGIQLGYYDSADLPMRDGGVSMLSDEGLQKYSDQYMNLEKPDTDQEYRLDFMRNTDWDRLTDAQKYQAMQAFNAVRPESAVNSLDDMRNYYPGFRVDYERFRDNLMYNDAQAVARSTGQAMWLNDSITEKAQNALNAEIERRGVLEGFAAPEGAQERQYDAAFAETLKGDARRIYDLVNNPDEGYDRDFYGDLVEKGYDLLNDQQKGDFNYWMKTDPEAAMEYLNTLGPGLLELGAQVRSVNNRDLALNPWTAGLAYAGTFFSNMVEAVQAPITMIRAAVGDAEMMDPNSPWFAATQYKGDVRGTQKEALGDIGGFFYDLITQSLDSYQGAATGTALAKATGATANVAKWAGLLFTQSRATQASFQEYAAAGYSPTECIIRSALDGAIESFSETVNLDMWMAEPAGNVAKWVNQVLGEGFEEIEGSILEELVDYTSKQLGGRSKFDDDVDAYMAEHKCTPEEAKNAVSMAHLKDAATGAMMASLSVAGSSAVRSGAQAVRDFRTGRMIMKNGNTTDYVRNSFDQQAQETAQEQQETIQEEEKPVETEEYQDLEELTNSYNLEAQQIADEATEAIQKAVEDGTFTEELGREIDSKRMARMEDMAKRLENAKAKLNSQSTAEAAPVEAAQETDQEQPLEQDRPAETTEAPAEQPAETPESTEAPAQTEEGENTLNKNGEVEKKKGKPIQLSDGARTLIERALKLTDGEARKYAEKLVKILDDGGKTSARRLGKLMRMTMDQLGSDAKVLIDTIYRDGVKARLEEVGAEGDLSAAADAIIEQSMQPEKLTAEFKQLIGNVKGGMEVFAEFIKDADWTKNIKAQASVTGMAANASMQSFADQVLGQTSKAGETVSEAVGSAAEAAGKRVIEGAKAGSVSRGVQADGEIGTVDSVDNVSRDGVVTLTINKNGEKVQVNSKDITAFASEGVALVVALGEEGKLDTNAMNLAMKSYEASGIRDAGEYGTMVLSAYNSGYMHTEYNRSTNGVVASLQDEFAKAGEAAREAENQRRVQRAAQYSEITDKAPGLQIDDDVWDVIGARMSEDGTIEAVDENGNDAFAAQRLEMVQTAAALANVMNESRGIGLRLVNGMTDGSGQAYYMEDGKKVMIGNGKLAMRRDGSGTIVINVNATENGTFSGSQVARSMILTTMAHEVTHAMERLGGAAYNAYRDAAVRMIAGKRGGADLQRLVAEKRDLYSRNGQRVSNEDIMNEIVADGARMMLADGQLIRQITKRNPEAAKGIRGAIDAFLAKLKKAFKGVTGGAQELDYLYDYEAGKYFRNLQQLWNEAFLESFKDRNSTAKRAGITMSTSKTVRDTDETNTQHSLIANYNQAVKDGDMEQAQEYVLRYASTKGYVPVVRYHQTGAKFSEFKTDKPVAGQNDSETPNGIFLKENDHDIGVGGDFVKTGHGGSVQMQLLIKEGNMLRFKNRKDAHAWYDEHIDGYKELEEEKQQKLKPLDEITNKLEDEYFYNETITEEEFNEKWNAAVKQIGEIENSYNRRMKKLLDDYFLSGKSGYDGIELFYDGHRYIDGKRENVHTFIAFKASDVKSADPVTYDDAGNVIPLEERFDDSDTDIRYSLNKAVEEGRNMIAVHDVSSEKLMEMLTSGQFTKGLPAPSIGIVDARRGFVGGNFGDVSLVFDKRTIAPGSYVNYLSENGERYGRYNHTFGGDAYTNSKVETYTGEDGKKYLTNHRFYDRYSHEMHETEANDDNIADELMHGSDTHFKEYGTRYTGGSLNLGAAFAQHFDSLSGLQASRHRLDDGGRSIGAIDTSREAESMDRRLRGEIFKDILGKSQDEVRSGDNEYFKRRDEMIRAMA